MEIAIYQIEFARDKNCVAFDSYEEMIKRQGAIDPDIYYCPWIGKVPADNLEVVYQIFNTNWPQDYQGHSLSVSDVVEVIKAEKVEPGFYYCDNIGFRKIEFDADKARY